ncbi:MAG: hypothetical protein M0T73_07485 [Deltaproteobacteria bacterium]|nr:hypothetical protein [Deltaproteobacteria bacterium]
MIDRANAGQGFPGGDKIVIRQSHKRAISVTLTLFDEALCGFDRWAQGQEVRSVFFQILNPLSEGQRKNLSVELGELRKLLMEIQDYLELDSTVDNAVSMIVGQCAVLWPSIVELEGRYLKGYGEVPTALEEYLTPRANQLNEGLRRISQIAGNRSLDNK